jgi:hypothetical protein
LAKKWAERRGSLFNSRGRKKARAQEQGNGKQGTKRQDRRRKTLASAAAAACERGKELVP